MNTIVQLWSLFDKFYYSCSRLEYVNRREKNIFRVRVLTYRGQPLQLSDGTVIRQNDKLLKIHLHNCALMKELLPIKNDVRRAFYVHQRVKESLPELANYLHDHPKRDRIKGVIGITLLTRGIKRLGFEVHHIRNPLYRNWKKSYMVPMYLAFHSHLAKREAKKDTFTPKFVMMSKGKLFDRHLNPGNTASRIL